MSNWFENYAETETGRKLTMIVNWPDRILEFRLLSTLGKPAVQAIASEVSPIINAMPDKRARDEASQFCGWAVGQRMRRAGYEIAQERGRVSNAPYKTGAVWHLTRPLTITDQPGPPTEGGSVELGVERNDAGDVIGRWRLSMTQNSFSHEIHEITGFRVPIDTAFLDAFDYAERYGFAFLRINDPHGLFPKQTRDRLLKERGRA